MSQQHAFEVTFLFVLSLFMVIEPSLEFRQQLSAPERIALDRQSEWLISCSKEAFKDHIVPDAAGT